MDAFVARFNARLRSTEEANAAIRHGVRAPWLEALEVCEAASMTDILEELNTAIAEEDFERAWLAVALGADVNGTDDLILGTPLIWAVFDGEATDEAASRRVRWLLDAGACVSRELLLGGDTSVHAAAGEGYTRTLELLLAADGRCALGVFDSLSRTPLGCAAYAGHLAAARLLIEAGSEVDTHDEARGGETALGYAVAEKREDMVKLLLAAGADPTVQSGMQRSALDRASEWRESGHPELQRIFGLLEAATSQVLGVRQAKTAQDPARKRGARTP